MWVSFIYNMFMLKKIILILLILLPSISLADANSNVRSYFSDLSNYTAWPVKKSTNQDIVSVFGPRYMYSQSRYDWHRGLDIGADLDTKVKTAYDGELFYQVTWEGAGNTVIIKHSFDTPKYFQGKEIKYFYTVYMHLNKFKFTDADIGKILKAGQVIGYVGQTGNATTPHLHFELRLGTWYELEIQNSYSTSQYSGFGFDPAVNPLMLFAPEKSNNLNITNITQPSILQAGAYQITMPDNQPFYNKVKFKIKDGTSGILLVEKILDLNKRLGFDPSTNDALDIYDSTVPYLSPLASSFSSSNYSIGLTIPATYIQQYCPLNNCAYSLAVYDIWGRKVTLQ